MKIEKVNTTNDRELTPPYARYLVPLIRPFENFDLFFVGSLRRRAVRRLRLQPGDRVLDVGCGPGDSFPYLVDAVTQSGVVVGVEISPKMAANAKRRIAKNGWMNVDLIVAHAKEVELQGSFDSLLLLGAPDIYACPAALANLYPYLKDDAHVVAFGAKLSRHPLGRMFNSIVRLMFRKPRSRLLLRSTMNHGKCLNPAWVRSRSMNSSLAGCSLPGVKGQRKERQMRSPTMSLQPPAIPN